MAIGTVAIGTVAIVTVAIGTVAIGTVAIVTVAIGTVAIGTVAIGTLHLFLTVVSTPKSLKSICSTSRPIGLIEIGLIATQDTF